MNKNKRSVKPILLTILAIIVAASILVPIPYYIERPGVPTHLNELVTVNGEQDEAEGSYSLTSVAIYQATVFQALKSKFEPFADLLSEKELFISKIENVFTNFDDLNNFLYNNFNFKISKEIEDEFYSDNILSKFII